MTNRPNYIPILRHIHQIARAPPHIHNAHGYKQIKRNFQHKIQLNFTFGVLFHFIMWWNCIWWIVGIAQKIFEMNKYAWNGNGHRIVSVKQLRALKLIFSRRFYKTKENVRSHSSNRTIDPFHIGSCLLHTVHNLNYPNEVALAACLHTFWVCPIEWSWIYIFDIFWMKNSSTYVNRPDTHFFQPQSAFVLSICLCFYSFQTFKFYYYNLVQNLSFRPFRWFYLFANQ